jgi:hypothetical protein
MSDFMQGVSKSRLLERLQPPAELIPVHGTLLDFTDR